MYNGLTIISPWKPFLLRSPEFGNIETVQNLDVWPLGNTRFCNLWCADCTMSVRTYQVWTPVTVRSPQLSNIGPGQNLDGWTLGNSWFFNLWCATDISFGVQQTYHLKPPVLVRSPELSKVEPVHILDGWPVGNTMLCKLWCADSTVRLQTYHVETRVPLRSPELINIEPGQNLNGWLLVIGKLELEIRDPNSNNNPVRYIDSCANSPAKFMNPSLLVTRP